MVELRKRKTPPAAPEPATKKAAPKPKPKTSQDKEAVEEKVEEKVEQVSATVEKAAGAANASGGAPEVGDVITLEGFGGELQTQDGTTVTLKKLVDESKAGVVLFTYPKASTPGCTKQVCFFRDDYSELTASGLSIFGLSGDSPKSNATFKTKQKLPYDLLCNPSYTLIGAIGLQAKPAKKTSRGVFIIDKSGKVLAAETGGPEPTKNVAQKIASGLGNSEASAETKEDEKAANVAADVADSAAKL
ncbi:putative disrupter of telomere silencing protein [Venturia nashicola]|nr:putative disrupter of telomere silencing protein [Venturia nashicola]